jgi:hypothetical protein
LLSRKKRLARRDTREEKNQEFVRQQLQDIKAESSAPRHRVVEIPAKRDAPKIRRFQVVEPNVVSVIEPARDDSDSPPPKRHKQGDEERVLSESPQDLIIDEQEEGSPPADG